MDTSKKQVFFERKDISEVTIPATVEEIGAFAFSGGYAGANEGEQVRPVLTVHGALGSVAEEYTQTESPIEQYRFVPFGQEDGNKPVPLHDPGHLGAHTRFPIRAPADEAVAGIGAALAPLERAGQDRGRLMGYGNKTFALIKLQFAVLLVPYSHGAIPISIPGA